MTQTQTTGNPSQLVRLDFASYAADKEAHYNRHMVGGVPDYAFALDKKLRGHLNALGPVRSMCKSFLGLVVPMMKQQLAMKSVAVSPTQYPEIYKMGEECAKTLGIGVPQIYVQQSHEFNALALASDDNSSVVILYSHLVEKMTPQELMFIIGHECGHLHNLHGVYNTIGNILLNSGARALLFSGIGGGLIPMQLLATILKFGIQALTSSWARAAEITCDRAGVICNRDPVSAMSALSKLSSGMGNVNLEELRHQVTAIKSSLLRFEEWSRSHPLVPKRLEAIRLFEKCETLYEWRPEMRSLEQPLTIQEVDRRCEQLVSVFDSSYQVESEGE